MRALLAGVTTLLISAPVLAAEEPKQRAISTSEVESWLDSKGDAPVDDGLQDEVLAPPPPPRHRGFVVESGIGAFGQIGAMKNISPVAPWFHLQFGYEPLRFLMVFAEGDLMISNTSYAQPPPEPRTYALWGFGADLRGTDGYANADKFNVYFGGELGVEWYQVSPHMALAVHGGVRDYTATFKRDLSSQPPLAWVSGVALRYTF